MTKFRTCAATLLALWLLTTGVQAQTASAAEARAQLAGRTLASGNGGVSTKRTTGASESAPSTPGIAADIT